MGWPHAHMRAHPRTFSCRGCPSPCTPDSFFSGPSFFIVCAALIALFLLSAALLQLARQRVFPKKVLVFTLRNEPLKSGRAHGPSAE